MRNVKVVACDMNAGFYKTFQNAYPHINKVFDRFHIVNQFLEDVIGNVRKDEYRRLVDEGRFEEAKKLKGVRFILSSTEEPRGKRMNVPGTERSGEKRANCSISSLLL